MLSQQRDHGGTTVPATQVALAGTSIPVAVLNSQFTRCYVLAIVRMVRRGDQWGIVEGELDNPAHHPWFLVRGSKDKVLAGAGVRSEGIVLVNGDFEIYPLMYIPPSLAIRSDTDGFHQKWCFLMPEKHWPAYSEIDRMLLELAIGEFVRT